MPESIQQIYDVFIEYCIKYMKGTDIDSVGVTVIVHPMYKLTAIASKGSFPQKERLGRIISLFSHEAYTNFQIRDTPDLSIDGNYIGVAIMKEINTTYSVTDRFLSTIEVFHRPSEELLKTIDESFMIAKLMEYKVLPSGELQIPDISIAKTQHLDKRIPEVLLNFNNWIERLMSGGSSTANIRKTNHGLIISPLPNEIKNFSKDFIAILKETQELWLKRPKREEELVAQLESALSEEKIEIPEDIEESSKVLDMSKRESEVYFREKKIKDEDLDFDPLNTLEMSIDQEERNDLANNRFGMDPFRRMNVNDIFFHSTVIP